MVQQKGATNKKDILDRIARIEGQLRGVRNMIEEERGCVDVITQISAIRQSLSSTGIELLKEDAQCKNLDADYLKALFKIN
ncbi:MAG: Protein of hypothetical function DUF156 [Candidatus Wolfebacteria bacterium GW2011_GWC2_39_22]|uniref:Protein of hypothetical function DUF156 n=1 Tax=Candidatus Wolfebacteria bacterium GW2011_GWC2_39_22 TaxID=1619013 RepID=A0A0G0RFR9_9BACT|nr:MAG: Protein of hypothetical function DUF156 [Candidatus Wolfebacteria bacterium GW2011_GWC2_39_22]HBI25716.1 hypothetical protein [Candidatus Wolfebacteria bacterium]